MNTKLIYLHLTPQLRIPANLRITLPQTLPTPRARANLPPPPLQLLDFQVDLRHLAPDYYIIISTITPFHSTPDYYIIIITTLPRRAQVVPGAPGARARQADAFAELAREPAQQPCESR